MIKVPDTSSLPAKMYYTKVGRLLEGLSPSARVNLLQERNPVYDNRTLNELIRVKGFILAGFEHSGTPQEALPYIIEELESGDHPFLIGAAAAALRGFPAPVPEGLPALYAAISNLPHGDDAFSFEKLDVASNSRSPTSAYGEIFKTFAWYGGSAAAYAERLEGLLAAGPVCVDGQHRRMVRKAITAIGKGPGVTSFDCCDERPPSPMVAGASASLRKVQLEDQDGKRLHFYDFFKGKPTVLVFFYSTCTNPNKCSLTISRLAQLQKEMAAVFEGRVRIAAISYDSAFDEPYRIKNYCLNRRLEFGPDCRGFRVTAGFELLERYFNLGVRFKDGVVVKHQVELYLLDKHGKTNAAFTRMQWDQQAVQARLGILLGRHTGRLSVFKGALRHFGALVYSLGIAFFPKCPLCFAAYMSAFGFSGADALGWSPYLMPVLLILAAINLYVLFRRCKTRGQFLPMYILLAGMALLMTGHFIFIARFVTLSGLALIIAAAMLNSLPVHLLPDFGYFRRKSARVSASAGLIS